MTAGPNSNRPIPPSISGTLGGNLAISAVILLVPTH